jgi:5-methylcytosine-specific restriction endonuclease McrA
MIREAREAQWRAQSREPVFAEASARAIERWIADYQQRRLDLITRWAVGRQTGDLLAVLASCRDQLQASLATLNRLLSGGTAARRPRRMPSLSWIARYHDLGEVPRCVRCGFHPPEDRWGDTSGYLARAHIIDRARDGLDVEANLAPLCYGCHRSQPSFRPGDEADAFAWFGLTGRPSDSEAV